MPMVRHFLGLQDDDEGEEDEEEEEEREAGEEGRKSVTSLCHPLCQCERCLPIQKVSELWVGFACAVEVFFAANYSFSAWLESFSLSRRE